MVDGMQKLVTRYDKQVEGLPTAASPWSDASLLVHLFRSALILIAALICDRMRTVDFRPICSVLLGGWATLTGKVDGTLLHVGLKVPNKFIKVLMHHIVMFGQTSNLNVIEPFRG